MTSKLKKLAELKSRLEKHKDLQKRYNRSISLLSREVEELELELNVKEITFTDHALVRYLERFGNLDVKGIANNLIVEYEEHIRAQKGKCNIIHNGLKFVVKDYTIVTILTK